MCIASSSRLANEDHAPQYRWHPSCLDILILETHYTEPIVLPQCSRGYVPRVRPHICQTDVALSPANSANPKGKSGSDSHSPLTPLLAPHKDDEHSKLAGCSSRVWDEGDIPWTMPMRDSTNIKSPRSAGLFHLPACPPVPVLNFCLDHLLSFTFTFSFFKPHTIILINLPVAGRPTSKTIKMQYSFLALVTLVAAVMASRKSYSIMG